MTMTRFFRAIGNFFNKLFILPLTKLIIFINRKINEKGAVLEKWLTNKSTLIMISLAIALVAFFVTDNRVNLFIENSAEVFYNQPVKAVYNEEAYVIEGLPETVDITLIGRTADLYLAKQLPSHEVTVDLTGLKVGTHKVKLKYTQAVSSINYKLDPSETNIVIYPKVSETRTLDVDILNRDSLDNKLVISDVEIDSDEVIIKGAEHQLKEVASVKALLDVKNISNPEVGKIEVADIPLVAYDKNGKVIDIEIVPKTITAKVTISSPNKEVPIKVLTKGELTFGKAIESIESSITKVRIYGDEEKLKDIEFVPITIDIDNLKEDQTFNVTIKKPVGVRSMSETKASITVALGTETSKEINDVYVEYINLGSGLSVQAASESDTKLAVIAKGSKNALDSLETSDVKASVDLSGLGVGTYEIEVKVETSDVKVNLVSKKKKITLKITNN